MTLDYRDIYSSLDCFDSFRNNLIRAAKNHYFGVACKLRGAGKLLPFWLKIVECVIDYGKIALVSFGDYLLLAQIVDGYETQTGHWANLKLLFLGDQEGKEFVPRKGTYVIFVWGSGEPFSLSEFSHDILEMWYLRSLIGWDQDKSKKRIMVEFEKDPGKEGWKDPMNSYEAGFIGIIAPKSSTNQIKKWEFLESKNNVERQQLWKDLREVESRFFFNLGMRHNPFAKEERQNNPEVMSGQSYFDAWEIKYQEGLVRGILEFQQKPWGGGKYLFQFGGLPTLHIEAGNTQLLEEMEWRKNRQIPAFLEEK